jgi:hypothetical protein
MPIIPHGAYAEESSYDVTQHGYAGSETGYMEVLEIKDPPANEHGIVIHQYGIHRGHVLTEWESVVDAMAVFKRLSGYDDDWKGYPGFKKVHFLGRKTPWFYKK